MAVLRQYNALGQERVDVPHIRSIELAVTGDFDLLAGNIMAGGQALVVTGFNLLTTGAIGAAANSLQLNVEGGVLMHPLASEAGSIFIVAGGRTIEVLTTTNTRVVGSFTANAVNFIGLDVSRSPDDTTSDLVMFLDAISLEEKGRSVPLGSTLDYVITVSTSDFSTTPGLAPVAKVTTDANNNVTAIVDARQLAFRLGTGGSAPNAKSVFAWAAGRKENTSPGTDVFAGGDKAITSLKSWMNAAMTRMWELGGGEYWYSPTADRNLQMVRAGTKFTNGEYFEWDGTNLHWRGLKFTFDNTTAFYNDVADQLTSSAGLTDLGDGECIYVDIDRTTNRTGGSALTAAKSQLALLGSPSVPGSRFVVAWRIGANVYTRDQYFAVGTLFAVATPTALGVVELTYAAGNPSIPKVAPQDANGSILNTGTAIGAPGFFGTGGPTGGSGVKGTGGSASGAGLEGQGTGTGVGVLATGGATNGRGLVALGVGVGNGIETTGGAGGGTGLVAVGGTAGGWGVQGTGSGNGIGVRGVGGPASGQGVFGSGGAPNGMGLQGTGAGTGQGCLGTGGATNGTGVKGTGGATNGIGVEGQGTGTGAGLSARGGATGSAAILTESAYTSGVVYPPLMKTADPSNNQREVIDPTGFMNFGRITHFSENWLGPQFSYAATHTGKQIFTSLAEVSPLLWKLNVFSRSATGSEGFSSTTGMDSAIGRWVRTGPIDTGPGPALAGDSAYVHTVNSVIPVNANSVIVAEWETRLENGPNGGFTNNVSGVGLTDTIVDFLTNASNHVGFSCNAQGGSSTNWFARVCDGATPTTVDTGVARTLNTWFRMRFEVHGASTPVGVAEGGMATRFFINDALVATIIKTFTGNLYWFFGAISADQVGFNNGDGYIYNGPLLLKRNRFANTIL